MMEVQPTAALTMLVLIAHRVIDLLILAILVSSILSWFRPDPRNPFVRVLNAVVEPILHPIRALLPGMGGLDFSPMLAVVILMLLRSLLERGLT
jgi:YggT family protein